MTGNEGKIPAALLHDLFVLDDMGRLVWRTRPATHFIATRTRTAAHIAANWNARHAGTPALTTVTPFGHRLGRINSLAIYAHRVVWAMHRGQWPEFEIDHINGDPGDNRIANLRDVPHLENLRNQAERRNNTSGVTGVRFYRPRSKWAAYIDVDGKNKHLGYFETMEEAVAARHAAQAVHRFHPNHGRKSA